MSDAKDGPTNSTAPPSGTGSPRPWWVGKFTSARSALAQSIAPALFIVAMAINLTKHNGPSWTWWVTVAVLVLSVGFVVRCWIGAVALSRRPDWVFVLRPGQPWTLERLRLIRRFGVGVAVVALILFVLSLLTGLGGSTFEILSGVGLLVGVMTVLSVSSFQNDAKRKIESPQTESINGSD